MTLTGMTKYSHGPTNGLFTPKGKMTPPSLNMHTNNHRHLLPTKGTQQLQQWQLQLITANPKGKLNKWTKSLDNGSIGLSTGLGTALWQPMPATQTMETTHSDKTKGKTQTGC